MAYTKPDDVHSPQDKWQLTDVIYDGGTGEYAISFGTWNDEPVIAARWNGTDEPDNHRGYPVISPAAWPTWFVLPQEIGISIIKDMIVKQAAGNKNVRDKNLPEVLKKLIAYDKEKYVSPYDRKEYAQTK